MVYSVFHTGRLKVAGFVTTENSSLLCAYERRVLLVSSFSSVFLVRRKLLKALIRKVHFDTLVQLQ